MNREVNLRTSRGRSRRVRIAIEAETQIYGSGEHRVATRAQQGAGRGRLPARLGGQTKTILSARGNLRLAGFRGEPVTRRYPAQRPLIGQTVSVGIEFERSIRNAG